MVRESALSSPAACPLRPHSPIISLAIGAALAWRAFRRHDPVIGVLAGLFVVPYIALYSLLIPLALLVSVIMWVIYGGIIAYVLLITR